MNFNKIRFSSFIPSYEKYFDILKEDKSITNYVTFSKHDSNLIFYDDDLVGFYKTMYRDDDLPDREIYIAIVQKYRGKGIANYILSTLCNNIFESDTNCEFIHLSIDKNNIPSIKMAEKAGFKRNEELEKELRKYNDNNTLIYTIKNNIYTNERENNMTM